MYQLKQINTTAIPLIQKYIVNVVIINKLNLNEILNKYARIIYTKLLLFNFYNR